MDQECGCQKISVILSKRNLKMKKKESDNSVARRECANNNSGKCLGVAMTTSKGEMFRLETGEDCRASECPYFKTHVLGEGA